MPGVYTIHHMCAAGGRPRVGVARAAVHAPEGQCAHGPGAAAVRGHQRSRRVLLHAGVGAVPGECHTRVSCLCSQQPLYANCDDDVWGKAGFVHAAG